MLRRPPRSTRTYTLCPDTTLCRARRGRARAAAGGRAEECGGGLCRAARGIVRWTALYRTVAARRCHRNRGRECADRDGLCARAADRRSEEHTSELQSLMRISYAVFCLTKKKKYVRLSHISKSSKDRITDSVIQYT